MIDIWDVERLGYWELEQLKSLKNYQEQDYIYLGEVCKSTKAMKYQQ